MKQIAKIGNLAVYREDWGNMMTLHACNGTDEIMQESFSAFAREASALKHLMNLLDYYTLSDIRAGLAETISEYDGALLSGRIAGFDNVEYFKRVDDTRFYKHYTHRPVMTAEEFHAIHG